MREASGVGARPQGQGAYRLWYGAKLRARKSGIEFTLPRSDVAEWLRTGLCQVTGLRLEVRCIFPASALSPSLDRIDPRFGYVTGNVRLVCWIYNRAKGHGSDADVQMLVEAMNAISQSRAA